MSSLPESCSIALKEWAGVCAELSEGRQILIVRKGGILEGPGGFVPEHRHFWLYPTHVHEAEQGLRREEGSSPPHDPCPTPTDRVPIRALAAVELIRNVASYEILERLEPFHVWMPETIRKRFEYRRPGLWVLGVRVYLRDEPLVIDPTPEQLGCRSWVTLEPPLPAEGLRSVLSPDAWSGRLDELLALLPAGPGAP
jgi:hypothetical protein